jgi:hypothetical protein
MADDEGLTAQSQDGTEQGSEAKTTPAGNEPSLADLEEELASQEAGGEGDEPAEGQSEEDELEEFEDGGKKAKLPKWVKARVMQQADYTRKTMAIAERGKMLEARQAQIEAAEAFQRENVREVAKVVALDDQLAAYEKVNWAELLRTNPQQHQAHFSQFQLLERERNKLVGELQRKAEQKAHESQQSLAKRYEASLARIAKDIPNFEEVKGKLNDYAVNNGYSLEELERHLLKPYRVSTLWKAYQFDELMARTRAKARQKPAEQVQPIQTVQTRRPAGSAAPRDSDDIGTWMAKERARMEKKRA